MGAVLLLVAGCSSGPPKQSAATFSLLTAPPASAPEATSIPLAGSFGRELRIAGVGTIVVRSASLWTAPSQRAAPGYRFVAVGITFTATGSDVHLAAASFRLVDRTLVTYALLPKGAAPTLKLPAIVSRGQSVEGQLTFEIPYGGDYSLQFTPSPADPVALVGIPKIDPAPTATPIVAPTIAPIVAPVVVPPVAPTTAPTPTPANPVVAHGAIPTAAPSGGSAGPGSGGSGYTQAEYETAIAFENLVDEDYNIEIPNAERDAAAKLAGTYCQGAIDHSACLAAEVTSITGPMEAAANAELTFMQDNPPAACFAAAYAADRAVANAYVVAAADIRDTMVMGPSVQKADAMAESFLARFEGYFHGC